AHDDVVHTGPVLDDDQVPALRAAEPQLGDRARAVGQQPRAIGGVDPGPRHHLGAVHRADVVLVAAHDGVQEAGPEDALLGEERLQCLGAPLDRGERCGMMVAVVLVAHAGSSQRSQRSTWMVSRVPPAWPHSSRAVKRIPYAGSSQGWSAWAATSGTGNEPSSRTTTPRLPRT